MCPETRGEYSEVKKLDRILVVCPAYSAEAERSFIALRRSKTWLRSTMIQTRRNSVAVCHVHQDLLDVCDLDEIIDSFINKLLCLARRLCLAFSELWRLKSLLSYFCSVMRQSHQTVWQTILTKSVSFQSFDSTSFVCLVKAKFKVICGTYRDECSQA